MADIAARLHPLEGRIHGNNGVSVTPLEAHERISLRA